MAKKSQFAEYICDLLSDLGDVKYKAMFGGFGVYSKYIIFAIIVDDTLYFKVDDSNRAEFEQMGSTPFSYTAKGDKKVSMSYYEVLPELLDDMERLEEFAKQSVSISLTKQKRKKK